MAPAVVLAVLVLALAVVASVLALPGAAGAQSAEDKPGSLAISGDLEVGSALTATLTDEDGDISAASWSWFRSRLPHRGFTRISGANRRSYTPVAADLGMFLKAAVSYTDDHGSGKSAEATTAVPVGVTVSTMVKNRNQSANPVSFARNRRYQLFRTGPNPAGYALTSVTVATHDRPQAVDIWSTKRHREGFLQQDSRLFVMTQPSTFNTGGPNVFNKYAAPAGTVLAPNTTYGVGIYFAVVGKRAWMTENSADDAGAEPGWQILDYSVDDTFGGTRRETLLRMELEGFALLGEPSPPRSPRVSREATGEVTLRWAAPAVAGVAPIIRYEVRHRKTDGGSFGAWTAVEDGDDTGTDRHDETSTVIDGLAPGTGYTFEVRAVNSEGASDAADTTAQAQTLYVSNEGSTANDTLTHSVSARIATPFTTGPRQGGYALDSVALSLGSGNNSWPAVSIWSDSSGSPGSSEWTLSSPSADPGSVSAGDPLDQVFTASNVTLAAGTTYWVVVDGGSNADFTLGTTTTTGEDSEPAPGWEIGDGAKHYATGTSSWEATTQNTAPVLARLAVRGPTLVPQDGELTVEEVAQVGAPLTAKLADPNEGIENVAWQWQRSASSTGPFTNITAADGGTSNPYTPAAADLGTWLKVAASYDDHSGPGQSAETLVGFQEVLSRPAVSNIGRPGAASISFGLGGAPRASQEFTTGSNPGGYLFRGVRFGLAAAGRSGLTWALHADDGAAPAAALLEGGTVPAADIGTDIRTFEELAHAGFRLEPDTDYWVVLEEESGTGLISASATTALDGSGDATLDAAGEPGWKLSPDGYRFVTQDSAWQALDEFSDDAQLFRMAVLADRSPWPSAPRRVAAFPGDGRAELIWSAPENEGGSPIARYEYRYKQGSGAFGSWTSVPDGDGDGSGADERRVVVSSLTNDIEHVFELRAVNSSNPGDGLVAATEAVTPFGGIPAVTITADRPKATGKFDRVVFTVTRPKEPASNRDQVAATVAKTSATTTRYATSFTTGSGTFDLGAVELDVAAASGTTVAVAIHADASGSPAAGALSGGALSAPSSVATNLDSPGRATFTVSPSLTLAANTTYWVVVGVGSGSGQVSVTTTASDAQDSITPGWSIGDTMQTETSGSWAGDSAGRSFRMWVDGPPKSAVVLLEPPAGNDWGIRDDRLRREGTFDGDTLEVGVDLAVGRAGAEALGFSADAATGGALVARVMADDLDSIAASASVDVVVVDGPAWVVGWSEPSYRFNEASGEHVVNLVWKAQSADMPVPSLNRAGSGLNVSLAVNAATEEGTADRGDYHHFSDAVDPAQADFSRDEDGFVTAAREPILTVRDDSVREGDEELFLVLSRAPDSAGEALSVFDPEKVPVVIVDDDATLAALTVASTPLLVSAGGADPDTYGTGESIEFEARFTSAVDVTGTPTLRFGMGVPSAGVTTAVSNTGPDYDPRRDMVTSRNISCFAQSFTTGRDAASYGLAAVRIAAAIDLGVVVNATIRADSDGKPAGGSDPSDPLATLTTPMIDDFPHTVEEFSAPSGVHLQPGTRYWVSLCNVRGNRDGLFLAGNQSFSEDARSRRDWSIGDNVFIYSPDAAAWASGLDSDVVSPTVSRNMVMDVRAVIPGAASPLVANTAKTADDDVATSAAVTCLAQSFTTAAGSGDIYLSSVALGASVASGVTAAVTIREDANGKPSGGPNPATPLATLTNPTLDTNTATLETFSATGVRLDAGTTYWASVCNTAGDSDGISVASTADRDNDTGSRSGWAIGDNVYAYVTDSADWLDHDDSTLGENRVAGNMKIGVNGVEWPSVRKAAYTSGRGTDTLRFAYDVTAEDTAAGGISWRANPIGLNGGSVTGAATVNDANLAFRQHLGLPDHKVDGSRVAVSVPEFLESDHPGGQAVRSVPEGAAAGTPVGSPVAAHEPDGDDLTYSVVASGEPDAAAHLAAFRRDFVFDVATGQVTVKAGAQLGFETRMSYEVVVRVTDGEDRFGADEAVATIDDTVTLTVTLDNVDEAGAVAVSGSPTVGLAMTATLNDPDGAMSVKWQWSEAATATGTYTDLTSGGTTATYIPLVADEGMYLRATATYTDPHGSAKTAASTPLGPVHQPSQPEFPESDYPGGLAARSVSESATAGTQVGAPVAAEEPDGDELTYSLLATADPEGAEHLAAFRRDFELDASTGQVTVKSPAQLDYETRSTYVVILQVTDGEDPSGVEENPAEIDDAVTLTVSVENDDEAGTVTVSGTPNVGVALTASLSDPDGEASSLTWQWSKAATATGAYTNILIGGILATSAGYTPVAADENMYLKATATYTDPHGSPKTAASEPVGPVHQPTEPEFPESDYPGDEAARSVPENSPAGTAVGTPVAAHEPDGDDLTYSVVATADPDAAAHLAAFNRHFELATATGQVTVRAGAQLDHETRATYKVMVQVTDDEDSSGADETPAKTDDTVTLTVTVTDGDDAGTVTIEGSPTVGVVRTASLSDPDGEASSVTWQWSRAATATGTYTNLASGGDSATYTPLAADRNMYLKATATYTDPLGSGRTAESAPFGPVTDHSAPEFRPSDHPGNQAARTVVENSAAGTAVGTPVAAFEHDGDALTYSVAATGERNGAAHLAAFGRDFELDAATGQVTVKSGAQLDFETRPSYTVIVQVADDEDNAGATGDPTIDDTVTLTITVVDDVGTATIAGSPTVGLALRALLADSDGDVSSLTWQWSRAETVMGAYTDITPGGTAATYTPVAADENMYLKATAGYTDAEGTAKTAESAPVGPVQEPTEPEFRASDYPGGQAARSVTESATAGSAVGAPVAAHEPDGDDLTYSVVATSDENGAAHLAAFERDFDLAAATGQVTVKEGAQLDQETRATYKVTLQVTDGEDTDGIEEVTAKIDDTVTLTVTVDNVDEPGSVAVTGIPNVGVALTATLTDGDGAMSVTWQWSKAATAAGTYADITTNGTSATYTPVAADKDMYLKATATYTDPHGSAKTAASAAVGPVHEPTEPEFRASDYPGGQAARSVAENSAAGSAVGAPVAANDADGDTLTYSVVATSDENGAAHLAAFERDFDLAAATGQVTVKEGARLDYETRVTYKVTLQVTDGEDTDGIEETAAEIDDTVTLTVTVDNLDEPGSVAVTGTPNVGVALTASLTDGDGAMSVTWQWSRAATAAGSYTDITTNGTSATYTPVAADKNTYLKATATYTDPHGSAKTAASAAVGPVHEPTEPEFPASDYPGNQAARTVAENSAAGTAVGAPVAADDADGDTLTYSVVATSDSNGADHLGAFERDFDLAAATGQVTVKSGARLDYETRATYKVSLQVTDGEDTFGAEESPAEIDDTVTLTVTLDNLDEPGSVTIKGSPTIGVARTARLTDDDGAMSATWQWSRAAAATGTYTNLTSGGTTATYTPVAADENMYLKATVTYDDPHGSAKTVASAPFGPVTVHSAPEFRPSDYPDGRAARTVPENAAGGMPVGAPLVAYEHDGDEVIFTVSDLIPFTIDTSGQVTVKRGARLDYETQASYTIKVLIDDGEDNSGVAGDLSPDDILKLTITLENLDEPGSVTIDGSPTIGVARTATLSDLDGEVSSVTWQWSRAATRTGAYTNVTTGGTSATYTPVAADENMYLKATAAYTDPHGPAKTAASAPFGPVSAHSAPEFRQSDYPDGQTARSVAENAAAGTVVGSPVAAHEADGDGLTYSVAVTGDSDAAEHLAAFERDFVLVPTTGQVAVKSGAQLDYETRPTYKVVVRVTDGENASGADENPARIDDTVTLTVTLTDADDPGIVTIEGSPTLGLARTATLTDDDGEVSSVTWQWSRAATATGTYTDITTGGTSAAYTPVAADENMHLKATAAYTDRYGPAKTAESAPFGPVLAASRPEFRESDYPGGLATRSVRENTRFFTPVGAPIAAHDADGDNLQYSFGETSDPDGPAHANAFANTFGLGLSSGQLTVVGGLDHEARSSYKVLVLVTDLEDDSGVGGDPSADDIITLTVTVEDDVTVTVTGQPEIGETLAASVVDGEGAVSSVMWQWSRAATATGTYTDITTGGTSATYTPVAADRNMYLKATAAYTDPHGNAKTAESVPFGPVSDRSAPEFRTSDHPGGQAARSVAENSAGGTAVGTPVVAHEPDGDDLVYSVVATSDLDGAEHLTAFNRDFALAAATGQVTVKSGAQLDYETRSSYKVTLQVTDGEDSSGADENPAEIDDTVTLTVTLDNLDEPGSVTVEGSPTIGVARTATLTDPDGQVSSVTWQWSKAITAAGTYTNITTGGTSAAYTPAAADRNTYLKATATYTDSHGPARTAASVPFGPVTDHSAPEFRESDHPTGQAARSVAENATAGTQVGTPVVAYEHDGDNLTYSVAATSDENGADHLAAFNRDFALAAATGQVTVKSGAQLDYETRPTYKVTLQVTDGEDASGAAENPARIDDTVTLTVTLNDADDAGSVSIKGSPTIGVARTARLSDPDGEVASVTWQWSKATTATGTYTDITTGGTSAAYTPVAADRNMYLKATAGYTDSHGPARTAASAPFGPVTDHSAPEFRESDYPGGLVTRLVREDAAAGTELGAPITAYDHDGDAVFYEDDATSDPDGGEHFNAFERDFSVHVASGQVTVKSGAQLDRATRSSYKVLIWATDAENNAGVSDVGFAVFDDRVTLVVIVTGPDTAGTVTVEGSPTIGVARTASLSDPDGEVSSVTWQWSRAATAGGTYTNITTSGTSATYTPVEADRNMYLKATATYSDSAGPGKTAESAPFGPVTDHSAPEFRESDHPGGRAARAVAENATAGAAVGTPVAAYEHDGDALTYSVMATGDEDAAAHLTAFNRDFELAAATGQVTVKAGAQLDSETRSTYKVTLRVTDGEDSSGAEENPAEIDDTVTLTVTVDNADDPGSVTVTGTPDVGSALAASLTDPDGQVSSVTWQWSRAATATGTYTDITTGGTSATYTPVAADRNMYLKATATYTDPHGPAKTAESAPVGPVVPPSAPEFRVSDHPGGQAARSVPENAAAGTAVGAPVAAHEADGDDLTYSAVATGDLDAAEHLAAFNRDFELAASTGQVTVKEGAQLDYETRSTYTVVVQVTDGEDADGADQSTAKIDDTVTLTVTLDDVDEAGAVTVEGSPVVAAALSASLSDPDGAMSVTWQWSRAATATGSYTDITANGTSAGYTVVAADENMYLKATTTYTDSHGPARTAESAPVGPVAPHSAPQFRESDHPGGQAARSVPENAAAATAVGAAVGAYEPDGDGLVYSVVATGDLDGAEHLAAFSRDFELAASTGQVTVKAGAQLDYETRSSYKVTVQVTDGEDASGALENPAKIDDTVTLTVTLDNVDEPGSVTIEGSPTVGSTLTASLTDDDGQVSSVTWQWSRAATATGTYTNITTSGTSAGYSPVAADEGLFLKATATYTDRQASAQTAESTPAGPVHKPSKPEFRTSEHPGGEAARSVPEDAAAATKVGAAVAAHETDGDELTYSVVATTDTDGAEHVAAFNRDFELSATTGQVTVKEGAQLDHETRSTYKVTVQVTDGEDASGADENPPKLDDTVTLTVTVNNVDEAGTVTIEGSPTVGATLTASLSDPDGEVSSVTWQWSRAATVTGTYTNITTGGTSATYTPVAADDDVYLKATAAYTDPHGPSKAAESAPVGPVSPHSAPRFRESDHPGGQAARSVPEGAAAATQVGAAVAAHEFDGDDLTYSIAATGDADAAAHLAAFRRDFELSATTGQVTVKEGAELDHETRSTYKVVVQVTDGEDADGAAEAPAKIDDTVTLVVTVENIDEPGAVAVTGTPALGETLSASLSDLDGAVSSVTWQWSRAATPAGAYTDITTGGTSATYTPLAADAGMYLKATAGYSDPLGSARTAESDPVGPLPMPSKPQFRASDHPGGQAARAVSEHAAAATQVGSPVAAHEPDGDDLTYSVVATGDENGAAHLAAFNRDFELAASTGQVTVKEGAQLDYETRSTYKVTVQVTDGKDALGAAETPAKIDDTVTLTVTVVNRDDAGTVTITGSPSIGARLRASLTDDDGSVSSQRWQWSRAATATGTYTNITTSGTSDTYTVPATEEGMYLKVTTGYTDALRSGRTAESEPLGPVVMHSTPEFASAAVTRSVAENSVGGADVGAAVTAAEPDGDALTYSVIATGETDGAAQLAAFNGDFDFDTSSAQVSVKAGASLDYESGRRSYKVVVQVTDGEDASGNVETGTPTIDSSTTLTVEVTNADEAGTVTVAGTAAVGLTLRGEVSDPDGGVSVDAWQWSKASSAAGPFTDISGEAGQDYTVVLADEHQYLRVTATYSDGHGSGKTADGTTGVPVRQVTRTNIEPVFGSVASPVSVSEAAGDGTPVGVFRATDGDGDPIVCSVADDEIVPGDDVAAFNRDFAWDCASGRLAVRSGAQLDYETRRSYAVVLRVSDRQNIIDEADTIDDAEVRLRVEVTNADDPGVVTFAGDAAVGLALAAVLSDGDGAVRDVVWQWSVSASQSGPFRGITGADEALYTPAAADEGRWLRATVTYTDGHGPNKTATATAATATLAVPPPPADRVHWRQVSFTRDRDTAYYSLQGWNPPSIRISEGGDAATIWVRLDRSQVERPYTVPITVTHGNGASPEDYRITPAAVSFGLGSAFQSFTIEALDDDVDDNDEYLILSLDIPEGLTAGHLTTRRIDIADDPEDLAPARLSFETATLSANEGDRVDVTVNLDAPPDGSIPSWSVLARLTLTSTLPPGEGVSIAHLTNTQVRFNAGKMSHTVRLRCGSDGIVGPDHRVTLRLGDVTVGSRRGGPSYPLQLATGAGIEHELVVTCADADAPADLRARIYVAADEPWYRPWESSAPATVVVSLSDRADREVVIPIETVHHNSLSGADYTGVPGSVTFAVGEQVATFEVWAIDDDSDDDGEWLEIRFGALPPGVHAADSRTWHSTADTYWDGSRYALEIIDDDDTPTVAEAGPDSAAVSFVNTATSVDEGGVVTVTVELSRFSEGEDGNPPSNNRIAVPLVFSYGGGATAADYGSGPYGARPLPATLVFEPGQRTHKFRVVAVDDSTADGAETVTIGFGTLPAGVHPGDTITITTIDDD